MSDDILSLDARHIWHPFTQAGTAPPPIVAASAQGLTITAADGRTYMDLISSWWVNLHGHSHPVIAKAIADQAMSMEHVIFADFTHAPAAKLAAGVAGLLPGDLDRCFFSDDGSTAIEVALKMAHQYWRNRGEDRTEYLAFEGGYHGDTVGAMSMGRSSGFFEAWDRMMFPVSTLPYPATWDGDPDPEAAEKLAMAALDRALSEQGGRLSALIVEPLIQGAGGMRMCRPEFLQALVARCRSAGVLVIFDEVMTGFGRTGAHFACVKAGVTPDMVCLSKGLTGGFLAMSLTVCRESIFREFLGDDLTRAFLHGHSYTANPLGCAAGIASLDLLTAPECQQRIASIKDIHHTRLADLTARHAIAKPRITGTIAAFDVASNDTGYGAGIGKVLKKAFLERGLLLRPLGNVLYLLPPYCITDSELHHSWDMIDEVLSGI